MPICKFVFFGLLFIFASACGRSFEQYALEADDAEKAFVKEYEKLVNNSSYRTALTSVCIKYDLDCRGIKIVKDMDGVYGTTSPYTDMITLAHNAFKYESHPTPHPGWLAAIVSHERFHTTQSHVERTGAATFALIGNEKPNAALEIPAYELMRSRAKTFGLTPVMLSDVEAAIQDYSAVLMEKK